MKRIYDFSRTPAQRNYTIADLQALKGTGRALTMSNPANPEELQACVDAGIDLFVVGAEQMEDVRRIAPTHFTGAGSTWAQFGSDDEIVDHAFDAMRRGADMYYTLRSFDVMERLAKEGIPVQSHIGLIPTFSHYCGGLRAWGRTAEEAMKVFETLKRMEDVGVFAVEAECIAEEVLASVNAQTDIVTFSLGSGAAGDAIFSFVADICGEASEEDNPPQTRTRLRGCRAPAPADLRGTGGSPVSVPERGCPAEVSEFGNKHHHEGRRTRQVSRGS